MIGLFSAVVTTCAGLLASTHFTGPVSLDIERDGIGVAGGVAQVLNVNTTSDWTAAAIIIELDAGSMIQDTIFEADSPEETMKLALSPTASATGPEGYGKAIYAAGSSGYMVGSEKLQLDAQRMDICWYNLSPGDVGWGRIAKLTFSDNAVGRWTLVVTQSEDNQRYYFDGKVVLGRMVMDE
jgi:hypothetical protein